MAIIQVPGLIQLFPCKGQIFFYEKSTGRRPAEKFLAECDKRYRDRFLGTFNSIRRDGRLFAIPKRFAALLRDGDPLWEFREFDHRLYAAREIVGSEFVRIVLFYGWVKDKKRSRQEGNEIETAKNLYREYLSEGGTR